MNNRKMPATVADPGASTLLRAIEGEVIPRLILAHRRQGIETTAADGSVCVSKAQVEQLCNMLQLGHDQEALAYVLELQAMGLDQATLYLDLLAPAARWFGVAWEDETEDFVGVTVALRRLQKLARKLEDDAAPRRRLPVAGQRALVATLPGEQHVFGAQLVVDMLREARWDVWDAPGATEADIMTLLQREWFAVVGLSVSSPEQRDTLAAFIRKIRRGSRNPDVFIMVGGRPFNVVSDLAMQVGADVSATDARDAVRQAEQLIQLLVQRN